jgi:hypothetical protein
MDNNNRPSELTERGLMEATLEDIHKFILPMLTTTALKYDDPIASEQLKELTDKIVLVANGLFVTYHFRKLQGDLDRFQYEISTLDCNLQLKLIEIFAVLGAAINEDIAENTIYLINKLTELRQEVFIKCNCFS